MHSVFIAMSLLLSSCASPHHPSNSLDEAAYFQIWCIEATQSCMQA